MAPAQSEQQKETARKRRHLETKLSSILKQTAFHVTFLISLGLIVSANMNIQMYLQNEELRDLFMRNKYIDTVCNKFSICCSNASHN